jgi:hypothetical protein
MRRWIFLGILLIIAGLVFEVLNIAGAATTLLNPGALFLGAIGGGLLAGYVYTKGYGFLIPGCILASLWLSITAVEAVPVWPGDLDGAIIVGGLGVSFFAIYLIDRLYGGQGRTWPVWPGLGLVLVSLVLALGTFVPESVVGAFFIVVPGVVLLVIYAWRKAYPFLIPACLLLVLGLVIPGLPTWTGMAQEQDMAAAGLLSCAIGLAFVAMYLIDRFYTRASNWWPLIPGLVLLVVGALLGLTGLGRGLTMGQWQALSDLQVKLWPLVLIALGVWLVLRYALRGARETPEITPPEDSEGPSPV